MMKEDVFVRRALLKLGQETGRAVPACDPGFYDQARRELLEMGDWSFARCKVILYPSPALCVSSVGGREYGNAVDLPGDCLRLRRCSASRYELRDGRLYVRSSSRLCVVYTSDCREGWSALAEEALVWRLAAKLAPVVTGSATVAARMEEGFERAFYAALTSDRQQDASNDQRVNGVWRRS